jgi:hypothetical protein
MKIESIWLVNLNNLHLRNAFFYIKKKKNGKRKKERKKRRRRRRTICLSIGKIISSPPLSVEKMKEMPPLFSSQKLFANFFPSNLLKEEKARKAFLSRFDSF